MSDHLDITMSNFICNYLFTTVYWPVCAYILRTGPQDNQEGRFTIKDSKGKVLIIIIVRITSTQCEVTSEKYFVTLGFFITILWYSHPNFKPCDFLHDNSLVFDTKKQTTWDSCRNTMCCIFPSANSKVTPIEKRMTMIYTDVMFSLWFKFCYLKL